MGEVYTLRPNSIPEEFDYLFCDSRAYGCLVCSEETQGKAIGTRALSGWIEKSASRTSLVVGIAMRSELTVSGIRRIRASSSTIVGDESLAVNRLEKYSNITSRISGSS